MPSLRCFVIKSDKHGNLITLVSKITGTPQLYRGMPMSLPLTATSCGSTSKAVRSRFWSASRSITKSLKIWSRPFWGCASVSNTSIKRIWWHGGKLHFVLFRMGWRRCTAASRQLSRSWDYSARRSCLTRTNLVRSSSIYFLKIIFF